MTLLDENKIKEFRCKNCNKLLCKTYLQSIIEIKCRGCKELNYFICGSIFFKQQLVNSNYFNNGDYKEED